jgi:hypothetical protein
MPPYVSLARQFDETGGEFNFGNGVRIMFHVKHRRITAPEPENGV